MRLHGLTPKDPQLRSIEELQGGISEGQSLDMTNDMTKSHDQPQLKPSNFTNNMGLTTFDT